MQTKGVQVARNARKLGMRSSDTAQIFLEDVRVPQRYRIGKEGEGFTLPRCCSSRRSGCGRSGRAHRQGTHDRRTIEYTGQRRPSASRILDNPGGALQLAELRPRWRMLRSLFYRATELDAE